MNWFIKIIDCRVPNGVALLRDLQKQQRAVWQGHKGVQGHDDDGNDVPKPLLRSLSLADFIKSLHTKFI